MKISYPFYLYLLFLWVSKAELAQTPVETYVFSITYSSPFAKRHSGTSVVSHRKELPFYFGRNRTAISERV